MSTEDKPTYFARIKKAASSTKASYCKSSEVPLFERLALAAARKAPSYELSYEEVDAVKKTYKHSTGCTAEEDALFDKIESLAVKSGHITMQQFLDHIDNKVALV